MRYSQSVKFHIAHDRRKMNSGDIYYESQTTEIAGVPITTSELEDAITICKGMVESFGNANQAVSAIIKVGQINDVINTTANDDNTTTSSIEMNNIDGNKIYINSGQDVDDTSTYYSKLEPNELELVDNNSGLKTIITPGTFSILNNNMLGAQLVSGTAADASGSNGSITLGSLEFTDTAVHSTVKVSGTNILCTEYNDTLKSTLNHESLVFENTTTGTKTCVIKADEISVATFRGNLNGTAGEVASIESHSDTIRELFSGGTGIVYDNSTGTISLDAGNATAVQSLITGSVGTTNTKFDFLDTYETDSNGNTITDVSGGGSMGEISVSAKNVKAQNTTLYIKKIILENEGEIMGTVSDLSNHTTDNLSEGNTNKYFTKSGVRESFEVSTSGPGSLTYDSSGGLFTYTGPTSHEIITEGDGIIIDNSGNISINVGSGLKIESDNKISTDINLDIDGSGLSNLIYDSSTNTFTYTPYIAGSCVKIENNEVSIESDCVFDSIQSNVIDCSGLQTNTLTVSNGSVVVHGHKALVENNSDVSYELSDFEGTDTSGAFVQKTIFFSEFGYDDSKKHESGPEYKLAVKLDDSSGNSVGFILIINFGEWVNSSEENNWTSIMDMSASPFNAGNPDMLVSSTRNITNFSIYYKKNIQDECILLAWDSNIFFNVSYKITQVS